MFFNTLLRQVFMNYIQHITVLPRRRSASSGLPLSFGPLPDLNKIHYPLQKQIGVPLTRKLTELLAQEGRMTFPEKLLCPDAEQCFGSWIPECRSYLVVAFVCAAGSGLEVSWLFQHRLQETHPNSIFWSVSNSSLTSGGLIRALITKLLTVSCKQCFHCFHYQLKERAPMWR